MRVITGASNTQKNSVLHLKNYLAAIFYQGTKVNIISFYRFRRSAFSVTTWHHRTLPKIPIRPKTSIIRRVWIFGAFFGEKSPSYRRINTVSEFSHLDSFHASGDLCLITLANSLDPDQARQNVWPVLDPNCLTL